MYKNAIDDQLADATAVLGAFHVVKLATQTVDEVRRRVQQDTRGHRGMANDPLYKIRTILRSGVEHLTERHVTTDGQIDGRPGEPCNVFFNPDVQRLALHPLAEDESGTQTSSVVGVTDREIVELRGAESNSWWCGSTC